MELAWLKNTPPSTRLLPAAPAILVRTLLPPSLAASCSWMLASFATALETTAASSKAARPELALLGFAQGHAEARGGVPRCRAGRCLVAMKACSGCSRNVASDA
eukprot:303073-Chlamydomonas_euryale.AAC.1